MTNSNSPISSPVRPTSRDLTHLKFFYDSSQEPDPTTLGYLQRHGAEVIDLHPHLADSSDQYLEEFLSLCTKGAECGGYYAISPIATDRSLAKKYLEGITFLTPQGVPDSLGIYNQVSAIVGYTPVESHAAAYSTTGAAGALAAGASLSEVKRIALSHRLLTGGNMRDEATAASLIGNILPLRDDDTHLVYEFRSARCTQREEYVRRSLFDYMLIRDAASGPARQLALLISTCNPDGDVTSMTAFATERASVEAAIEEARSAGYGISTHHDDRYKLHVLRLYSRNVTFPVKGFAQFFTGAPVPTST